MNATSIFVTSVFAAWTSTGLCHKIAPMRYYVRELRERNGWTQAELANRAQVAPATVSQWETGGHDMRKQTRNLLGRVFRVDEHELHGYDLPPTFELPDEHREVARALPGIPKDTAAVLASLLQRDDAAELALLLSRLMRASPELRKVLLTGLEHPEAETNQA